MRRRGTSSSAGRTERAYFVLRRMAEQAGAAVFDSLTDGVTCWSGGHHAHIVLVPQRLDRMLEVLAHEVGHQYRPVGRQGMLTLKYAATGDEAEADRRGRELVRRLVRVPA